VAHGAGIGVFPTYASTLGGKIIPLEVELRRRCDIWLSDHPGNGGIAEYGTGWWTPSTRQNSRGLRTNSSIQANLKGYIRVKP
jgi:hypothetical protein